MVTEGGPGQDRTSVQLPHILVVIPTRNRPADLERCLESLTLVAYPSWELLIVDQSGGDITQRLVETYRAHVPKLTYGRMQGCGPNRARNLGLQRAGTGIVAYLDDDCTIGPLWLADVAAAFHRYPSVPLIFGSLHAIPHDHQEVLVPSIVFARERTVTGSFKHEEMGMGASMYLWPLRSLQQRRFDLHLGPGTRWPAADEQDYAYRLVRGGEPLLLTPAIRVYHHGIRTLREGAAGKLFRGYALANGAMDMKMIRSGDTRSIWRVLDQIRSYLFTILASLVTGRRPLGLGALVMYVRGLAESFLRPVDRAQYLYVTARQVAWRGQVPR